MGTKMWMDWLAPGVVITSIIVLFSLFFIQLKEIEFDSNLFLGSITALFGLLGILIQIKSAKERDHQNALAQIRLKGYDARREIYDQLLKPFMELMFQQKRGEEPNLDDQIESTIKANFDIHLLGSDETCNAYYEWRGMSLKKDIEDPNIKSLRLNAMLIFYSRIILAIRRDLGQRDTHVDEIQVLSSFINDIDEFKSGLREAMKWKTAAEVP